MSQRVSFLSRRLYHNYYHESYGVCFVTYAPDAGNERSTNVSMDTATHLHDNAWTQQQGKLWLLFRPPRSYVGMTKGQIILVLGYRNYSLVMTIVELLDYWKFGVKFQLSSLWVKSCCGRGTGTVRETWGRRKSTAGWRFPKDILHITNVEWASYAFHTVFYCDVPCTSTSKPQKTSVEM
jgi:hypothetical protein